MGGAIRNHSPFLPRWGFQAICRQRELVLRCTIIVKGFPHSTQQPERRNNAVFCCCASAQHFLNKISSPRNVLSCVYRGPCVIVHVSLCVCVFYSVCVLVLSLIYIFFNCIISYNIYLSARSWSTCAISRRTYHNTLQSLQLKNLALFLVEVKFFIQN